MTRIKKYEHTIYASYLGYVTQAIINNFVPLLFLTFSETMELSLEKITFITTINFAVQLLVDLIAAGLVDKIGYRISVVSAHIFSAAGLLGLALFPSVFSSEYAGILTAVILYAIGGGMIEVVVSPIVEACPTEKKEAAMSLLHSFYCWGHVAVVLVSTLFFACFGIEYWPLMSCIWAIVPLFNCFYFLLVPLYPIVNEHEKMSLSSMLRRKMFWLLMVIMVCAGASEQAMSQWASAFAESGLNVSKTVGDLAGPCTFAALMGTARALYGKYSEKLPLKSAMAGSAILCIGCYFTAVFAGRPLVGLIGCAVCGFSVGIFWPGTFSIAATVLPTAGTAMYALMALAGDVGCSAGPTLVGLIASGQENSLKAGLLAAVIFPALILIGTLLLRKKKS
ncbi:MAG: MFS transporter [Ruminococcus sp.]|nr:MFS transporter [Ruminococcus sp.]